MGLNGIGLNGKSRYRLVLYNIRYGGGAGWRFHTPIPFGGFLRKNGATFAPIRDFIKSCDPDLVGLVEVDGGSAMRAGGENQALLMAKELGHHCVFRNKYDPFMLVGSIPPMANQGNAVLSRNRIVSSRYHYFERGVKRLVIEVELEDLVFLLVHLSLHPAHRQKQLSELVALVRSLDKPLIVAGDFNAFGGAAELSGFMAKTGLASANSFGMGTYPSKKPKWELDYILHSRHIDVLGVDAPRVRLSDHLPLVCDFRVNN